MDGNPAHPDLPDLDIDLAPGKIKFDFQRHAIGLFYFLDLHVVKIVYLVKILLPAVHVQVLLKVAQLVEQSDAMEIQVQIAGRLDMVPGQDPQSPRINGQGIAQAVLGGKISDTDLAAVVDAAQQFQVLVQLLADTLHLA